MSPKAPPNLKANSPSWVDAGLQGGMFLLTLVQDAAQYAPVPYLQQAAGSVLVLFNTIATVKNNKEDFQRLANDAISLMAVIWRAYQISNRKEDWPPRALRDVILDFKLTLEAIVEFAQEQSSKKWIVRAVYKTFDAQRIVEYRQTLTRSVQTFQVASDLNVNEMLVEVLERQNKMMDQMQSNAHMHQWQASVAYVRPSQPEARPEAKPSQHISNTYERPSGISNGYASRAPHMPMSFTNIQNSGINLGGGGVRVTNIS